MKAKTKITGDWFAGFVDGEGSLGIAHHGGMYVQPRFRLNQRDDDGEIVRAIRHFLGVGYLAKKQCDPKTLYYSANAKPQLALNVSGKDCLAIVRVLDQYPLRSKKFREYPIWRRAVLDYAKNQGGRWLDPAIRKNRDKRMLAYKKKLEAIRVYRGAR